jgi:hypothetical protein
MSHEAIGVASAAAADLPRPRVHIVSAVHKNFEVRGVLEPASEMVERNEGRVPIDYTFFEVRVE